MIIRLSSFAATILVFSGLLAQSLILQDELEKIELNHGVHNISLKLTDGTNWKMRISIPESADQNVPLILALHWAGDATTYEAYMDCLALPGLRGLGGVIIAPSAAEFLWWQEPMINRLVELVNLAKERWPIDTERVLVTGYSDGGTGSWQLAKKFPQHFTAAIPIAGYYEKTVKMDIPVLVLHGDQDDLFPFVVAQKTVSNSGCDFRRVSGKTHYEACNYVNSLKNTKKWLVKNWASD